MAKKASILRPVVFAVSSLLFASATAYAGPYGDTLGKCLVSSTSTADRTMLIRWLFVALSLHPDVQSLSAITVQQREQINKETARIMERLLTESCVKETREAMKYEGADTIEKAFSLLGEAAMRELISDPKVAAGVEDLTKNLNAEKLAKALSPQE